MTLNSTLLKNLYNQHFVGFKNNSSQIKNIHIIVIEEYHGQLHHHGEEMEDIETEEHDGSFQPVSDAKMMRLGRIIKDLRSRVPVSAEAPGEKTTIPDTPEVNYTILFILKLISVIVQGL